MTKTLITCEINNVKPTIAAVPITGSELDNITSSQIAIVVGEDANTPAKFFTAVRDMADKFIGELRFQYPLIPLESFSAVLDQASIAELATTNIVASSPLPAGSTLGTVTWVSLTPANATVDPDTGEVTGVNAGTAVIEGTSDNGGITSSDTVTVTA